MSPCPFCGATAYLIDLGTNAGSYVRCRNLDCDSSGPNRRTSDEAARAWDCRPTTTPIPPVPAGAPGLAERVLSIRCPVQTCRAPIGRVCGPDTSDGQHGSICMRRLRAAARTGDQESAFKAGLDASDVEGMPEESGEATKP